MREGEKVVGKRERGRDGGRYREKEGGKEGGIKFTTKNTQLMN